ncbi:hypothetical protein BGX23_007081 [Mortierella sp. AD031]|nr:hypothetical protein BGX23_007081 [Mortierella sp. AD031]
MPFRRLDLELLSPCDYVNLINRFEGYNLVSLYRIAHAGEEPFFGPGLSDWSFPPYIHGTGHCGCVDLHDRAGTGLSIPEPNVGIGENPLNISIEKWCSNDTYATRGILLQGHRMEYVRFPGNES